MDPNYVGIIKGIANSLTTNPNQVTDVSSNASDSRTSTNPENTQSNNTEELLISWINQSNQESREKVSILESDISAIRKVNDQLNSEHATLKSELDSKIAYSDLVKGSVAIIIAAFALFVFLYNEFKEVNSNIHKVSIVLNKNSNSMTSLNSDLDKLSPLVTDVVVIQNNLDSINNEFKLVKSSVENIKRSTLNNSDEIKLFNNKVSLLQER
ncbi:hypothetical protein ACQKPX_10355 [Photobacterium sp. DNB23_23_1]